MVNFSLGLVGIKRKFPSDMFDKIENIRFENENFKAISSWDTYLRINYGDYMKLPPVEERRPGHHIFVSTNIPYKQYLATNEKDTVL